MKPLRLRYQTIDFGEFDIHLRTLRDKLQYFDTGGMALKVGISSAAWPIFGVLWESGKVLAHIMADYSLQGKRILEVGCGLALASLVLNHRGADITATDYHPEAETFLLENTLLNKDPEIAFVRTAWGDMANKALGLFDLIIGSDLLYERDHPKVLAAFINQHSHAKCTVLIVDPGRGYIAKFKKNMEHFGFDFAAEPYQSTSREVQEFTGKVLSFNR